MPRIASFSSQNFTGIRGFLRIPDYPLSNTSTDPTNEIWRSSRAPFGYQFVPNVGIFVDSPITNMQGMFQNNSTAFASFNDPDIATWDVSTVTNMIFTFDNLTVFNQDLGSWDTSNVTSMFAMFRDAQNFNNGGSSSINNWDTTNVTSMTSMFQNVSAFNQDIGLWDTSNVTRMDNMFNNASSFDNGGSSSINNWDTTNVTKMDGMFQDASVFNQDISNWNISSVDEVQGMFDGASSFNQDISSWDTSNVRGFDEAAGDSGMYGMFSDATVFNQDLTSWNVQNIDSEPFDFATNSALQESNYPIWGTTGS